MIIEDTGQQEGKHELKHRYWESIEHPYYRYPLPVGDYVLENWKIQDVISRKAKRNIPIKKMDFLGTYNICVDSKKDIQELCMDICGPDHDRFRDEVILAANNGIKLVVLVENTGGLIKYTKDIYNPYIGKLEDLHLWKNERLFILDKNTHRQKYPRSVRGATLMKACMTMRSKYGVEFEFTTPERSGERILEILQQNEE